MEVKRDDGCYKVRVKNHIDKLLTKFGMEQAKTTKSPMDPGYLKAEEPSTPFGDQTKYRSLVGGLMYIACTARPDIAVGAAILGRKFSAPNEADWTAAKRVLRYLKATREYYLRLGGEPGEALVGHSEADWAGDPGNRRSTSGFVFTFGGGAISWASRQQLCVTKQIALEYCPTNRLVADLFTKPLGPLKLGQFCGTLGLLA
ncbi:secreted RxLR effector protein 161-like [Culex quinquefasciatus]|uniref:secreted RxLR effector protein 161-like n=1 Tax=Culex quinquefasciatus TaxID=7176 RepID=UPI0018E3A860|nr:secreted RxLR effector protein 161-like [Culex quinquefasciatus]